MKTKWFVIAVLSMSFALVRLASATAEHEHKEGEEKIPATANGIWAEVKEHEVQLGKIIADKKLDQVHEVAFEIRDMVNALPDKSMDLPADKLAALKSNAKYVADIAKRLDESGDAGDAVNTKAQADRLAKLLQDIETLYPEDALHATQSGAASTYVCPMHPEVRQKQPGSCPKCGMTLKPIQPEAALSAGTEISHKSESKTGME